MWTKLDKDTFVNMPDTKDLPTVKLSVLEKEISELEGKLVIAESNVIAIPEKVEDKVVSAIEEKNEFAKGEVVMFQTQLDEKTKLLEELKKL